MNPVVEFLILFVCVVVFTGIPSFIAGALVMFLRFQPKATLQEAVEAAVTPEEYIDVQELTGVDPASKSGS